MKNFIKYFYALFAIIFCSLSIAGPFALDQGMSLDQIKKIAKLEELAKFDYITYSLPAGSDAIQAYLLLIVPNIGLCRIFVVSNSISTDVSGAKLKSEFYEYAQNLSLKYGAVSEKMDFLHADSIWTDSKYWMRSLEQKERSMSYYWVSSNKNLLPDSIKGIELNAVASSKDSGNLTVMFEFNNFKQCQEVMQKDNKKSTRNNMKNF